MNKGPHYHGHRQRLRERLARDSRALADYELLELLLAYGLPRKDTKPLAKELLGRFKTLRGVMEAPARDLLETPGFGPGLESFWAMWRELKARLEETPVARRDVLQSPSAVADMARARLGAMRTEEFWVAMVDSKNRLMDWNRQARGTVDHINVHIREVLATALEKRAAGLILVHNHPGGDPRPSARDLELTKRMVRAARDVGLKVLDHVIVTGDRHFSLREEGLL